MFCKRVCTAEKDRSIADAEWMSFGVEIFLKVYQMLRNFFNLLKFHGIKCCGINYEEFPLHGALDITIVAVESTFYGKKFQEQLYRPGLFNHVFLDCQNNDSQDIPRNVVYKVEDVFSCLEKSDSIEHVSKLVKDISLILESLPSNAVSHRSQLLCFLLKKVIQNIIGNGEVTTKTLNDSQRKLVLNLVNIFIRDWGERSTSTQPRQGICVFCNYIIDENSRQWGVFCCKDAKRLNQILNEWILKQSTTDNENDEGNHLKQFRGIEFAKSVNKYRKICGNKILSQKNNDREKLKVFDEGKARVINDFDTRQIHEDNNVNRFDREKTEFRDLHRTIKYQNSYNSNVKYLCELRDCPNKAAKENAINRGDRKAEKDRIEDRDLTEKEHRPFDDSMKEDTHKSHFTRRRSENHDMSDREEKRDDFIYKRRQEDIQDLSEASRNTVKKQLSSREIKTKQEKIRKIRSDRNDHQEKNIDLVDRETKGFFQKERSYDDSKKGHFSSSNEGRHKARRLTKDDVNLSKRRDKLDRKSLSVYENNEHGEKDRNAEKATGRRGKKKLKEKDNEKEEMLSLSKSKEVHEERMKKADVVDSERRGVSYRPDEEGKVLKGDGKRKGRSSAEKERTNDSDLIKKRKGDREVAASTEDKSTLNSEDRKTKEVNTGSKKGSRLLDSSRTVDDDYSKINGSRYQRRKPGVSKLHDVEIGSPNSIEYQLSNQYFVKLGWTLLPTTKTMRKIVLYQARTAKPHLDWFKRFRYKGNIYYNDSTTPFINFHPKGSGRVFYPNGRLAIRVSKSKSKKYDTYTVFTPGGKDSIGVEREPQIVAVFDTMGNGAVYDEDGRTRLSYNQIGGICTDNPAGLPFAWTWNGEKKSIAKTVYEEKSLQRLEKFLNSAREGTIKSSGSVKVTTSPLSSRNKEKKAVVQKPVIEEYEEEVESGSDFIREYPKETCRVKMICMKLNENLSLRILDRRNINLRFLAGAKSIRIELGTTLNFNEEVASYFVDSNLESTSLKTKSEDPLTNVLRSEDSLCELAIEFRKIRKSAEQRKKLRFKYRPFVTLKKLKSCSY